MLHCLKLKLKYTCLLCQKIIIISVASNLSFFTFNTKNNTNILHINIIYQPVEYCVIISAKKRIIWMQGARHGFINGKQHVKAAEKQSVECIVPVNFVVYYFELFGDAVTNGPLTIYCLTGLLFTAIRLNVSEVLLSSVVSAHHYSVCVCMYCVHTMYVCRAPSADSAVRACTERSCLSRPNAF